MPNYDMSETACRERVEAARRLDKLDIAVKILADTCEELNERISTLQRSLEIQHEINHHLTEEIKKCSKLALSPR